MLGHSSTLVVASAVVSIVAAAPAGSSGRDRRSYGDDDWYGDWNGLSNSYTTAYNGYPTAYIGYSTTTTPFTTPISVALPRTDPLSGRPIYSGTECLDPYSFEAVPDMTYSYAGSGHNTSEIFTGNWTAKKWKDPWDEISRPAYGNCCRHLGFTATPMVSVFAQSVLLVFFTVVPTLVGRCLCSGKNEGEDDDKRGSDLIGLIYIALQALFKLIAFYIIWNKTLGVTEGQSGWDRYQAFVYLIWAGPLGAFCAVVAAKSALDCLYIKLADDARNDNDQAKAGYEEKAKKKAEKKSRSIAVSLGADGTALVLSLFALPSFLTHVIPGFLIYLPIMIAVALALALLLVVPRIWKPDPEGWFSKEDGKDDCGDRCKDLAQAFFMIIMYPIFITICAFTFTYIPSCARSVYYGVGWSDALVREYEARSLETAAICYAGRLAGSGESTFLAITAIL